MNRLIVFAVACVFSEAGKTNPEFSARTLDLDADVPAVPVGASVEIGSSSTEQVHSNALGELTDQEEPSIDDNVTVEAAKEAGSDHGTQLSGTCCNDRVATCLACQENRTIEEFCEESVSHELFPGCEEYLAPDTGNPLQDDSTSLDNLTNHLAPADKTLLEVHFTKAMEDLVSYFQETFYSNDNATHVTIDPEVLSSLIFENWTLSMRLHPEIRCPDLSNAMNAFQFGRCMVATLCFSEHHGQRGEQAVFAAMLEITESVARDLIPKLMTHFPDKDVDPGVLGQCDSETSSDAALLQADGASLSQRTASAIAIASHVSSSADATGALLSQHNASADQFSHVWQPVCGYLGCNSQSLFDVIGHLHGHTAEMIDAQVPLPILRRHIISTRDTYRTVVHALNSRPSVTMLMEVREGIRARHLTDRYNEHIKQAAVQMKQAAHGVLDTVVTLVTGCWAVGFATNVGLALRITADQSTQMGAVLFAGITLSGSHKIEIGLDIQDSMTKLLTKLNACESSGYQIVFSCLVGFVPNDILGKGTLSFRAGMVGAVKFKDMRTCHGQVKRTLGVEIGLGGGLVKKIADIFSVSAGGVGFIQSLGLGLTVACCNINLENGKLQCAGNLLFAAITLVLKYFNLETLYAIIDFAKSLGGPSTRRRRRRSVMFGLLMNVESQTCVHFNRRRGSAITGPAGHWGGCGSTNDCHSGLDCRTDQTNNHRKCLTEGDCDWTWDRTPNRRRRNRRRRQASCRPVSGRGHWEAQLRLTNCRNIGLNSVIREAKWLVEGGTTQGILMNYDSKRCLDTSGEGYGGSYNREPHEWSCDSNNANQKFSFEWPALLQNNRFKIESVRGYALERDGGIFRWKHASTSSRQQYQILPGTGAENHRIFGNSNYFIRNRANGNCIEKEGGGEGNSGDGGKFRITPCTCEDRQKFRFEHKGTWYNMNYYELQVLSSKTNKCLTRVGNELKQDQCQGSDDMRWIVDLSDDISGYPWSGIRFRPKSDSNSHLAWQTTDGTGTDLRLKAKDNLEDQRWFLSIVC